VHPHARLIPGTVAPPAAPGGPPRVAFVGEATFDNGWPRFRNLLGRINNVAFHHFAGPAELRALDGLTLVDAETTPTRPFGMVRALAEHRIDVVLALSPWPETFADTAHAALAAGADLLATAGSGQPETLATATANSLVLANDAELVAFFADGRAAAHVRARRSARATPPVLLHSGSTATIGLGSTLPTMTDDPDLHLALHGARLDGTVADGTWRFALPPAGAEDARRTLRLRSRHLRGSWDRAAEGERRRLGVAVAALSLDGVPVPPADPRRVSGWHSPEAGWQWTDGDAALLVGGARLLEVRVLPVARYWQAPLLAGMAPPV
jgi:hypothetical protein